jgi:holo-[acyl-carrier protein] synthase
VTKSNTPRVSALSPPLRVGIDLVEVAAVEESVRTHAERYLTRIYTEREVSDCGGAAAIRPDSLAARFAAKEATLKVLGPAQEGVGWRSIEVVREAAGSTGLELSGRAAELAHDAGISGLAVSLSHEAGFATAVVVATVEPK